MLRQVLTEVDLTFYPKIALLIFLGVFLAISWRVWTLSRRMDVDAVARMPLDDDAVSNPRTATPEEVIR